MIRGKTPSIYLVGSEPQVRRSWDAETEAEPVSWVGMWVGKTIQAVNKARRGPERLCP